jgi:MFS family permease
MITILAYAFAIFANMLFIYLFSWLTEKFIIRHLLDDPRVGLAVSILAGFLIMLVFAWLISGITFGSTVLLLIAALIDWALRFRRRKQQKVDPSIFE